MPLLPQPNFLNGDNPTGLSEVSDEHRNLDLSPTDRRPAPNKKGEYLRIHIPSFRIDDLEGAPPHIKRFKCFSLRIVKATLPQDHLEYIDNY